MRGIGGWGSAAASALIATVLATGTAWAGNVYSFRDRSGIHHFTNVPSHQGYKPMALKYGSVTVLKYSSDARIAARRAALKAAAQSRRASYAPSRSSWAGSAGISRMIDDTARRYRVDPALVHAVVRAESGFNYRAVSSKGAAGLMQLMPGTARDVGVRNVFHPQENVEGGVYYLRSMLDRFRDVRLALAAYNAGPGAVESYGGVPPYSETQQYIGKVLRYRQEHLLRYGRGPASASR